MDVGSDDLNVWRISDSYLFDMVGVRKCNFGFMGVLRTAISNQSMRLDRLFLPT
jgi:hypothetical protein